MKEVFLLDADKEGREKMTDEISRLDGYRGEMWVGKSIMGEPLAAYPVGDGEKIILLVGAHHGAEHITANLLFAFADFLLTEKSICGIDIPHLLHSFTFLILPAVNPDGIELSLHGPRQSPLLERQRVMCRGGDFTLWQSNARGVDLNHNYDAGFAEYKRIERETGICAGPTKYSGEYPESEPESRAVASLVRAIDPAAVVSLHTQGEEIFLSPREGGASDRVLRIARRLSLITGYKISEPCGTAVYGGLSDYTGALGIPSFTVECGRGTNPLSTSHIPHIFSRICPALVSLPTLL